MAIGSLVSVFAKDRIHGAFVKLQGKKLGLFGSGLQRAIDEGIVTREEIFLSTKLWPSEYE